MFPPRCLTCSRLLEDNQGLCQQCLDGIETIEYPYCDTCGKPLEPPGSFAGVDKPVCFDCRDTRFFFEYARSIGKYKGVLRECIHLLKYKGKKIILKSLDKLIGNNIYGFIPLEKISFIIPVPVHKKRLHERGFNQAELIARLIGDRYKISVFSNLLNKSVNTSPQVTLSREERSKNVRGVFAVTDCSCVRMGTILLIDDVYTTGATVNECARVLRRAKAKEVYVLTLAHGI